MDGMGDVVQDLRPHPQAGALHVSSLSLYILPTERIDLRNVQRVVYGMIMGGAMLLARRCPRLAARLGLGRLHPENQASAATRVRDDALRVGSLAPSANDNN